jgi:hypothetical protein
LSTITRCPPISMISIRPAAATGHGEDGAFSAPPSCSGNDGGLHVEPLTIAGANTAASSPSTRRPSRDSRRHVNSWLADSPFRRAVTEPRQQLGYWRNAVLQFFLLGECDLQLPQDCSRYLGCFEHERRSHRIPRALPALHRIGLGVERSLPAGLPNRR